MILSINGKKCKGVRDLFEILGYSSELRLRLVVERQNGEEVEVDVVTGKKM